MEAPKGDHSSTILKEKKRKEGGEKGRKEKRKEGEKEGKRERREGERKEEKEEEGEGRRDLSHTCSTFMLRRALGLEGRGWGGGRFGFKTF